MIAIALVSAYLILVTVATATAKGAAIRQTERGSSALVFLATHPKAGTHHSRARLERRSKQRIWNGLKLAGVYDPFMCIHRHESISWTIYNPPYAGGMQENDGFQATYGGEYLRLWGNASHWIPALQVLAAYRAFHGYHGFAARGYTPWSTASACGL